MWVGNDKICAMGVHNRDMVTSHGLALNCDIDLSWFSNIVPCGIQVKNIELKNCIDLSFVHRAPV